ncbi:MAG: UDP-N-acetylglucosamine--N-acetylmuramyl-(pentapeptide) pyrophosphoryl-undecaprenol N-acetylglucosamine transferase [Alphaproteobacteria bacterium]|nr:UDP-N-acetylglucosamine--N-acetylmuramyl-(pentapeptide) pyrophosphoryl-undecaprenol N-acetylglucosamine transferase [Alphaproteobacteria bacterium]
MKKTIAITTGGTGGHYFPAKALCDAFLKDNYKVFVFLDRRAYKYKHIWDKNAKVYRIASLGFKNKSLWHIIKMLAFIKIGFFQSFFHFLKNRPQVLVSFGGYSSIPTVFAAIILRIPIVMHEQNATLGKAHRLFLKFAKAIATTFLDTKNIPSNTRTKHVGLPVRKEFVFFRNKQRDENSEKLGVCILGGSLGAKIFSDIIPLAFAKLSVEDQQKITVHHQCREELLLQTSEQWKKTQINYIIKPFFNNIAEILWESDLVIARAGSSSIAEINTIGRYAFYIPYALAAENHQELNAINAKMYSGADYALEKDFNVGILCDVIKKALHNRDFIKERADISKNSGNIKSTEKFKEIIEDIIR